MYTFTFKFTDGSTEKFEHITKVNHQGHVYENERIMTANFEERMPFQIFSENSSTVIFKKDILYLNIEKED